MAVHKLTPLKVKSLTKPGRYGDGGGLWLQVRDAQHRSWLFRYMLRGKAREMGLGPTGDVSLAEARDEAQTARKLLRKGIDPIEHRRKAREEAAAAEGGPTFTQVVERYLKAHETTWRNVKHRQQWRSTLDLASKVFGNKTVAGVATGDVMKVLEPIWHEKPETASRLRGRIEAVLDYAKARGWRSGENPARWKGHVSNLLPARTRVAQVQHHPALPWQEIGAFMASLRAQEGTAARALEFTILTAARTGEALGARWGEIDLKGGIWTVPADRMKAKREHRVPLSEAALAVLEALAPNVAEPDAFVFLGGRHSKPLSNMAMSMLLRRMERADLTVHGFRSTFRDWAAESTNYPREVAEAALAHVLADKVEAAYRRGDLFEKRRQMMESWAKFCARPAPAQDNVRPLRRA